MPYDINTFALPADFRAQVWGPYSLWPRQQQRTSKKVERTDAV